MRTTVRCIIIDDFGLGIICLPITLQLSLVTGRWYGKKDFWISFDDSLGVELCEDVFVIAIFFGNNIKQREILPFNLD